MIVNHVTKKNSSHDTMRVYLVVEASNKTESKIKFYINPTEFLLARNYLVVLK